MRLKHAEASDRGKLRVMVTTPSAHAEIPARARQDLGLDIEMSAFDSQSLLRRAVDMPLTYDLVQLEYWMVKQVLPTGVLQGIPVSEMPLFADVLPLFTEGTVGRAEVSLQGTAPHTTQFVEAADSRDFAEGPSGYVALAPTVCNSDTLGWRMDTVSREVTSWADLLHPAYRGRVALADIASVSIVEAALACEALGLLRFRNKGDLTREEIDATIDVLGEARRAGQFHGFWRRYEESVAFMVDGPVVLQSLWPPAVAKLVARDMPLAYRPLKEGARGWAGGFALASHLQGERRNAALAYVNWYQSGWAGAFLTRQGYYSAVPSTARKYLSADEWAYWYEGASARAEMLGPSGQVAAKPGAVREGGSYEQRMGHIACWSSRMREDAYLQQRWREFTSHTTAAAASP